MSYLLDALIGGLCGGLVASVTLIKKPARRMHEPERWAYLDDDDPRFDEAARWYADQTGRHGMEHVLADKLRLLQQFNRRRGL